MADSNLPDYAPMMADYHVAYATELRAMVGTLPIEAGEHVLEIACGDGAYSGWLVDRVGPSGRVTAIDILPAFLDVARGRPENGAVTFIAGEMEHLPFAEATFDLTWCAQSLYSLNDPVTSVRAMRRLVKPGGRVAVLENDSLHHILLPWPVEIELALRAAEHAALARETGRPSKFYVGRRLAEVFRESGLVDVHVRTFASNRQAPLDSPTRGFLEKYLADLRERTAEGLEAKTRKEVARLTDPRSDGCILDQPGLNVICIDHVVHGKRPETTGRS